MVVLVTGAAGFLGSYITDAFRRRGDEVIAAGRPAVEIPSREFLRLVARGAPNLIVHCAAPSSVGESMRHPRADLIGSVAVLASVLECARALPDPPRLLCLSSAAVYGQPRQFPIPEHAEQAPISPYGFHRVACELLLREYAELFDLPVAAIRIFSAYGEGLRRQILWDVSTKLLTDGRAELFGTGEETRDFVHVTDVAQAAIRVAEKAAFEGEAYNLGSGMETSIATVARLLAASFELPENAISFSGERRPGDPVRWRADIRRLEALGFAPLVGIEAGVDAYASWIRASVADDLR